MKIYRNLYIFVCIAAGVFFVFSPQIYAGTNAFEKLRKESANLKTLQANFEQKKSMKILSRPLVSEGRFYYAAPDSIRWEYVKPVRSIVIAHNNSTKRYIDSDGKMVENKMGGAQAMNIVLNEITGWINGRFVQNLSFTAVIHEGTNTMITLTPVGQGMAGFIKKIEIVLSGKAATVKSVKIIEDADSFTQINFKNVEINNTINPSVFQDVK
ncbi:MAG TPA: outer membrane lipoprotein carrier protein LolA [Smithella sp.]|nr:outer membrane lipoprotein carrier protein LolA [Smithella sp.]